MMKINFDKEWGTMEKLLLFCCITDRSIEPNCDWKEAFRVLTGCSEADLEGALSEAKVKKLITLDKGKGV
jgi:hypothetical protein